MRKLLLALALLLLPSVALAQQPTYQTKFTTTISNTTLTSGLLATSIAGEQPFITHIFGVPGNGAAITIYAAANNQCALDYTLTPSITFPTSSVVMDGDGIAPLLFAKIGDAICIAVANVPFPGYASWGNSP
jgi:hypothetical protein